MKPSSDSPEQFTQIEHWLRILAETSPAAILIFRDTILFANHTAVELSGYDEDELLQLPLEDLLSYDVEDPSLPAGIVALQRKDGNRRLLRCSTAYIQVDWQPAALVTAIDITDQARAEAELRHTRERFLLAQRAGRWVTWEWIPASDRLHTSTINDPLIGEDAASALRSGADFLERVRPEDRDRLRHAITRTMRRGEEVNVEVRCQTPAGDRRWIALGCTAVRGDAPRSRRVIGVAHDITEQKITENALFQERDRAFVTLSSVTDGVIRTDARGIVDYLNPVAERLIGWPLTESYGRPLTRIYKVIDEETEQEILDPVQQCLAEQREVVTLGQRLLIRRDGTRIPIHDSAAPILDRRGLLSGAVLVLRDLSQMRRTEQEMRHLASHDPLTGLVNRREFEQLLREIIITHRGQGSKHALCHLDLDNFKLINDTCGHTAGDQLLRQVAALLKRGVQPLDILARIGIDEFALLARETTLADARARIESLCGEIHAFRFQWEGNTYSPRVSAGLVPFSADSTDPETLMGAADSACFVAKDSGGGRIHVFEPDDTAIAERYGEMQWVSRIQKGFDERRFCLWHQTIEPVGEQAARTPLSELFIRLIDEEGRVVSPDHFIPAAERYGMIDAIDRWVVQEALAHIAGYEAPDKGEGRFAVNVSGQSLGADGFLEFIIEQVEATGIAPERILFEITETAAIANLQQAMRFISVLKTMGCLFVLDDFGQGLSSFGYLRNLPLDFIKIDGAFVREMVEDPIQAALVSSIQDVGKVMGLETIAESVEDEATFAALAEIGVDYVQGYFLDRPKPLTTSSPPPVSGAPA